MVHALNTYPAVFTVFRPSFPDQSAKVAKTVVLLIENSGLTTWIGDARSREGNFKVTEEI